MNRIFIIRVLEFWRLNWLLLHLHWHCLILWFQVYREVHGWSSLRHHLPSLLVHIEPLRRCIKFRLSRCLLRQVGVVYASLFKLITKPIDFALFALNLSCALGGHLGHFTGWDGNQPAPAPNLRNVTSCTTFIASSQVELLIKYEAAKLFGFLLAFHVASDLGLNIGVGFGRALPPLCIFLSSHLYIIDRFSYEFCLAIFLHVCGFNIALLPHQRKSPS